MPLTQFDDPTYLEAVYAALFALLKAATFAGGITMRTTKRVAVIPDQIAVADQPALLLLPGPLHVEQKELFGPSKWTFTALAVIYARADGTAPLEQDALPSTVANYIIWGLVNAFATRPPYDKQTLGGLVYHCWLEGNVDPEIAEQQIVITLPIYIVPGPVG